MNCLCCGKPLRPEELPFGWHKGCIKRFFGTETLPEIEIGEGAFERLALNCTDRGCTVPGVQKKLSLHLFSEGGKSQLALVDYPTGYIFKPQVEDYEALPESEQLVMCMADAAGIATVPHALIKSGDKGELSYITKRIDRVFKDGRVCLLAMEDFCQLSFRSTQDKYRSSYEKCAKIISDYSSRRGLDITELFMRLVFSFIVGNSDMHLKNLSLVETAEKSESYILSPAYDLLPVNTIMPGDPEQFALAMNGKKANLRKKDFMIFADECGISKAPADKMINRLVSLKPKFIDICNESYIPANLKEKLTELICERTEILN